MRVLILVAALVALMGSVVAGEPYTAPLLKRAETLEPPAELRADAIKLLRAVQAGDLDAAGRLVAPNVTVVTGAIDMGLPRRSETLGPWRSGAAALVELGQHTGGDWDLPPDVDIGAFLSDMELDFIEGALTDGQPWGTDPLLPGTICTYGFHDFDPAAVAAVAARLRIEASGFVMVDDDAPVFDRPGGRQLGALSAERLYAMDYDTDAPTDWMAIHRPEGGVGFIAVGEDGLAKPYAAGICFARSSSGWRVVGQASTGL